MANNMPLNVGDFAPDFTLDTDGIAPFTLSEQKGKNVVVYFYPKDDTPGCTIEAKDFTTLRDRLDDYNTVIIGISPDSVHSHNNFKEKHCLTITLGADVNHTVCEAYGVWVEKNMYGKKYMGVQRASFLVNKQGRIAKIWPTVSVEGHAKDVLETVRELENNK